MKLLWTSILDILWTSTLEVLWRSTLDVLRMSILDVLRTTVPFLASMYKADVQRSCKTEQYCSSYRRPERTSVGRLMDIYACSLYNNIDIFISHISGEFATFNQKITLNMLIIRFLHEKEPQSFFSENPKLT